MIVWLNGTFGAGKTTTAKELTALLPDARILDSEYVGYMLRHVLGSVPVDDFQEWPPWRGLVVETAAQVHAYVGGTLVVPQTVLVEAYWQELRTGLEKAGLPVHLVLLHADDDTLRRRIDGDTVEAGARQWRLDHLAPYAAALPWLRPAADTVVDTAGAEPHAVAERVAAAVRG
ncbi:AAA family ATPase [Jiangella sp. DSM 45060]|uniref:AAA family ATPase n=1 Tax=Jiangella sp. DSM 45060 TaxID=1798224 RepID=UPI00087B567F|nr:AAA family ATPase [Jiangella sp. DSM 45060]SDT38558.1 Shikimate kinase [Jiangella sp. DSM 45060]